MPHTMSMRIVLATSSILALAPQALCHMQMSWPYAIRSEYNPNNNYTNIDYSMTSPLLADGSNFPCKGYQNDRPMDIVVTYEAGHQYNMTLEGSATHGGGSCQLSLSYDNGATFKVIQSMIGGCSLNSTYNFTIPSYAPNGQALFAWTWQNYEGNREYYMNCAEVEIVGSPNSMNKRNPMSFNNLPYIWKANLEGVNNCTTSEFENPVYPEPGPAVIYGNGMNSSSAMSSKPGVCDAATPYGATYEDLEGSESPSAASSLISVGSSTRTHTGRRHSTTTKASHRSRSSSASRHSYSWHNTKAYTSPASAKDSLADAARLAADASASSTCPPDVTLTVYASVTASSSSGFSTSTVAQAAATTSAAITYAAASSTIASAAAASSTTSSSGDSEADEEADQGYVSTNELASYLPCVPDTFLCTTNTTWVTCDQSASSDGSSAWVYEESRSVAAGTMCVPNLSPYSFQTEEYAQQNDVPTGYYRDDRIARSQPYGACSEEGALECYDDGQEFLICDDGAWVMMGSVAAGTTCENNEIVASS